MKNRVLALTALTGVVLGGPKVVSSVVHEQTHQVDKVEQILAPEIEQTQIQEAVQRGIANHETEAQINHDIEQIENSAHK